MTKNLLTTVDGSEIKPIAPFVAQIVARTPTLPIIEVRSIRNWEQRNTLSLTIKNNCLDNSIVSHVQACTTVASAWSELKRLFESQDTVTKMYLKDKLHTLKMKENNSVRKHIDIFHAYLQQLSATSSQVSDDKFILNLMRSMPPTYITFISSMRGQPNLTL